MAAWASSCRRLAGRPASSASLFKVRLQPLVASSTWLPKAVASSASRSQAELKACCSCPSRPTPRNCMSRSSAARMRLWVASSWLGLACSASRARYIGRDCPARLPNCTTAPCCCWWASRRAGVLQTPLRWLTTPQLQRNRSPSWCRGSITSSQLSDSDSPKRSSRLASWAESDSFRSLSKAGIACSTCSGVIASKGGRP